MWTGLQKCWRVKERSFTHVSYLLTAASVNAGRVKRRAGLPISLRGERPADSAWCKLWHRRKGDWDLERNSGLFDSFLDCSCVRKRWGLHGLLDDERVALSSGPPAPGTCTNLGATPRQRRLANRLELRTCTLHRWPVLIPPLITSPVLIR